MSAHPALHAAKRYAAILLTGIMYLYPCTADLPERLKVQWRYNLTDACFSYDLRNPNGIVKYCEAYQNSLAACMEWDGQGAHYLDTDWYSVRLVNKTDPKLHFCFYIEDSKPPTGNPADCGLNPHILDPLTMEGMTIGGVRVWVPGVIKPI
eukprot:gb/GECG01013576.1/.p1 GENE.gb/GECG01013576.1/~~gb/GECG01013576.1/.p1  ORF type:complete len:151 (+),score=8.09 gb/GECG01013576.1/:1-453(+)